MDAYHRGVTAVEKYSRLGVGITSMEEALRQLQRDGVLASQGAGRVSLIRVSNHSGRRRLKIAIQLYEQPDLGDITLTQAVFIDGGMIGPAKRSGFTLAKNLAGVIVPLQPHRQRGRPPRTPQSTDSHRPL